MNGMIKNIQIHINLKGEKMKPILVYDKLLFDYKAIETDPSSFGVVIHLTEGWKIEAYFINDLNKTIADNFSEALKNCDEKIIEKFETSLFNYIIKTNCDENHKYIKIDENLILEKITEALK